LFSDLPNRCRMLSWCEQNRTDSVVSKTGQSVPRVCVPERVKTDEGDVEMR
jgi:hypothetical protein